MLILKNFFKLKNIRNILLITAVLCLAILSACLGYVWLQKKYVYPLDYKREVFESSKEFNLDKALVFALIKTESSFNHKSVSEKGAIGLMQITTKTGEYIAKKLGETEFDLYSAKTNVRYGCYYLSYLLATFNDTKTALCAYNAGEGKVRTWLKNSEYSLDGKTLYKIPFKETSEYVDRIEKSFAKYKKLYGKILDK